MRYTPLRFIADLSSITARGTDATGPAASLALDLPVAPLGFPSWRLKFLHEVRLIPLCAGFGYALLAWTASEVHLRTLYATDALGALCGYGVVVFIERTRKGAVDPDWLQKTCVRIALLVVAGEGIADVLHQSAAASIDSQLRATKVILELGIFAPMVFTWGTAAYAVMIALRAATTGHHLSRADASADNVGSWVYIFTLAIIVGFVLTQLLRRLHATELELVKRNEEAAALNDALHESNERREYEIQMKSKEAERCSRHAAEMRRRLEEWHCAQELVLGQEDENAMSESYSHHTAKVDGLEPFKDSVSQSSPRCRHRHAGGAQGE